MKRLTDKGILLILGLTQVLTMGKNAEPVIIMLAAIGTVLLSEYANNKKQKGIVMIVFAIAAVIMPRLAFFVPIIIYESVINRIFWGVAAMILFAFGLPGYSAAEIVFWLITVLLAVILAERTSRVEKLEQEKINIRDTGAELTMALKEKNKNLMEKQDYEIYLATLRERNRIAREIHDNVGHMLSRSILQVGALMAINKEEPLHGQLESVNETLNQAMTSIRESVHDLHDDSVDLEQAIREAVSSMEQDYEIKLDYDMSPGVPRKIKYCFISTVKEALSNVIKHSDADKIMITLREHPAFYQLTFEDNGTVKKVLTDRGIGLTNMRERVAALNGAIRIHNEQGFKIFISIAKQEERE